MVKITKAQRKALKRVYDRAVLYVPGTNAAMSYRQFRRTVKPYFDNSGCVIVEWCGMWLGIEPDGYTHS